MEFTAFVRTPFTIEAVQITDENLEEVCELIGKEIVEKDGQRHIVLNRQIVPKGYRAYPGGWVTRMGDRLHYYTPGSFQNQFVEMTDEWKSWFEKDETDTDEPDVEESVPVPDVAGGDV